MTDIIAVDDIRAQGLTDPPYNDAKIGSAIALWQSFLERACKQWFYPKELELLVDGNDSGTLFFGVPIINIDEIRINNCTTALDTSLYKVYNAAFYPHDRQNPRISLVDQFGEQRDIFTAPDRRGRRLFRRGRQNQYIKGTFGCVESDGTSAPPLIKWALTKLVIEKLTSPPYVDPEASDTSVPSILHGIVVEEWTDGHKIKYAQSGGELAKRQPGLAGITDDQEILNIIKLFRAPIGLATPADPSFR
jgi:hypothetical protein